MAEMNIVKAVNSALDNMLEKDENVLFFGQDAGYFGGVFGTSEGLQNKFGSHRVFDTPLSEGGIAAIAFGMGINGLRPVAEIQFADYIFPAYDQIVNEIAKLRHRSGGEFSTPVTFRTPAGGGIKGGHHHSQSPESQFTHTPGLKVVYCSNPYTAKGLLTAALADLARDTIAAFEKAIADSGIAAPLFITQNDGTVAEAHQARRLPVYSFASGATNSMRGAAYLSGLSDAMVVDVGGTTTDIGMLRAGFPREANNVVEVGGVRTLFRMPDLVSIALGGGTLVEADPLKVGPESTRLDLLQRGLGLGGHRLTCPHLPGPAGPGSVRQNRSSATARQPASARRSVKLRMPSLMPCTAGATTTPGPAPAPGSPP